MAHIAPEMQKTMQAVAAAGGDMTKVNGDSIYPVLNMLNTKYFIMPLQGGQTVPVLNPYAYGNAWFVDEVKYVNNANEEIDGVGKVNLRHVAVADAKFKEQLAQSVKQDDTSVVKMTQYKPNNLTYEVKSSKGGGSYSLRFTIRAGRLRLMDSRLSWDRGTIFCVLNVKLVIQSGSRFPSSVAQEYRDGGLHRLWRSASLL